jgi:hypothetical protein
MRPAGEPPRRCTSSAPTSDRGSGSGRVTIYAAPPGQPFPTARCPSCGAMLLSPDGYPPKVVHSEVVPEE